MRIDSHHHLWQYDPVEYDWIDESMSSLRRNFSTEDLKCELNKVNIEGCIAVQARTAFKETAALLECAASSKIIKGIVGWVDLCHPNLGSVLDELKHEHKLVGFREVTQGQPAGTLLQPDLIKGVNRIHSSGYTYDLLIFENQLTESLKFVDACNEGKIILDHFGKPAVRECSWDSWAKAIKELSLREHVTCKLSGLATEAHWKSWTKESLLPYIEHVLECFGPARLMFGSDWPVSTLAISYGQWVEIVEECISSLSAGEQSRIMGDTAMNVYSICHK
jgi:L-fuconolactonase